VRRDKHLVPHMAMSLGFPKAAPLIRAVSVSGMTEDIIFVSEEAPKCL